MKKLFILCIGAMLSVGAMAQTAVDKNKADIKQDANKVKHERAQRNKMITHGKLKKASVKQKEVNMDRKDMNADKKELKIQGVKHPVADAKHPVPPNQ